MNLIKGLGIDHRNNNLILVSKNQVLQILYLKHMHIYKT